MIAFASSLDQAGPITRTAEDAAIVLQAMAGFDPADSTSVNVPVPDYRAGLDAPLAGRKLGLPKEFLAEGLDDGARAALESALDVYRQQGAEIVEVSESTIA